MANSANSNNRSPSPNLSRPNSNPRNSETKSPMRRSFSGNPFPRPSSIHTNPRSFVPATPANSPADFSRRNSIEKEEKENEKNQIFKPTKVRSPAVAKSAKNFMTPTISAASKINPSPKKKVLTERNEPLRTSVLFSDGKGPFGSMSLADFTENFDSKSDMGLNQRKVQDSKDSEITDHEHNEAVLETPFNSNSSQKDPSFNPQALPSNALDFTESSDNQPMDESNNKPFVSSISPNIAPLDADPSLPPYDPKTNYLSPRPQFLHYRPNPRLEIFFHKELGNGGKRLEESFLSEGFSDTEVTEESESENSSVEVLNEELEPSVEVRNEELNPEISEPRPNTTPIDTHISMKTAEEKREIKPQFFTRTKAISLLMFVLIACLSVSVTDSPRFDLPAYENLNLSNSKFYEASINGFARNLKQWSAYSTSYFSQLISSSSGEEKLGSLQFTNLTYLLEDPFTDEKGFDNMEPVPEDEVEIEQIDQKSENGDGGEKVTEEEEIIIEGVEIDHLDTAQKREQGEITLPVSDNLQNSAVLEDQSALISEDPENSPEIAVTWVIEGDNHLISDSKIEATTKEANLENTLEMGALISEVQSFNQVDPDFSSEKEVNEGSKRDNHLISVPKIEATTAVPNLENTFELVTSIPEVQSSNPVDSSLNLPEDKSSLIPAISLLALAVMAASVFIYLKNKKENTHNSLILIDPLLTKKLMIPNPPSQVCPPEVDLVGESCPSEMSSFDKSFFYSKREEWGTYEAHHSQEKRRQRRISKRESLASSSEFSMDGSPSYGSFTTYERLPSKHGYGDDEVVTPVRRSSRIKNQVTSS